MALFKLRLPGRIGSNGPSADALSNTPAESVEVIRKRARHRLMGSVILVLGAVVGLPLLFDSQPRPVAIDTPIVIPDRNQVAPLVSPSAQSANPKPEASFKEVVIDAAAPSPLPAGAAVEAVRVRRAVAGRAVSRILWRHNDVSLNRDAALFVSKRQ